MILRSKYPHGKGWERETAWLEETYGKTAWQVLEDALLHDSEKVSGEENLVNNDDDKNNAGKNNGNITISSELRDSMATGKFQSRHDGRLEYGKKWEMIINTEGNMEGSVERNTKRNTEELVNRKSKKSRIETTAPTRRSTSSTSRNSAKKSRIEPTEPTTSSTTSRSNSTFLDGNSMDFPPPTERDIFLSMDFPFNFAENISTISKKKREISKKKWNPRGYNNPRLQKWLAKTQGGGLFNTVSSKLHHDLIKEFATKGNFPYNRRNETVLEIGCGGATSTLSQLFERVYCADLDSGVFSTTEGYSKFRIGGGGGNSNHHSNRHSNRHSNQHPPRRFPRNVMKLSLDLYAESNSWDTIFLPTNPVHVVFVDAMHDFTGVIMDIRNILTKVRCCVHSIIFHDFFFPGVMQAISANGLTDYFGKSWKHLGWGSDGWGMRKKKILRREKLIEKYRNIESVREAYDKAEGTPWASMAVRDDEEDYIDDNDEEGILEKKGAGENFSSNKNDIVENIKYRKGHRLTAIENNGQHLWWTSKASNFVHFLPTHPEALLIKLKPEFVSYEARFEEELLENDLIEEEPNNIEEELNNIEEELNMEQDVMNIEKNHIEKNEFDYSTLQADNRGKCTRMFSP